METVREEKKRVQEEMKRKKESCKRKKKKGNCGKKCVQEERKEWKRCETKGKGAIGK